MTSLSTPAAPPVELDAIRRGIADRRFVHLPGPLTREAFEALVARLGKVSRQMDVVVSADREREQRSGRRNNLPRPSIYQATEMDFHTDPPPADLLAFYCVAQDEVDGSSLLVDLGRIEEDFSPDEVDALGRIEIAYSPQGGDGRDGLGYLELVKRHPDGAQCHYMPWGVRRPDDEGLAALLDRFESYVRGLPVVSLRLAPGECLFVNNRRMLHGRGPLAPGSGRHLLRVHVEFTGDPRSTTTVAGPHIPGPI